MRFTLSSVAFVLFLSGCPKKATNVVIEGWHGEEEWTGQCYYHKNFSVLGRGEVYDARQDSMAAMMSQWRGERNDGIQFDEGKIVDIPTKNVNLDLPGVPACLQLHNIDVIVRIRTLKDKKN